MSGVEAGIWAEGIYLNGRYYHPSDLHACRRCGIRRVRRTGRAQNPLCLDCRTVEFRADKIEPEPVHGYRPVRGPAGVIRFEPVPEPMSAEDMAWCERQVERHFWASWERDNRRGGVSEAVVQKARELSRGYLWTAPSSACTPDQQFSTRDVHNGLHENGERVFDEKRPTKSGVA